MFGVIILLTTMGFLLYALIGALKKLVIPWHESVVSEVRGVAG